MFVSTPATYIQHTLPSHCTLYNYSNGGHLILSEGVVEESEGTSAVFVPHHQLGNHGVVERGHLIT